MNQSIKIILRDKIKRLKRGKIYDYSIFNKIENRNALYVALSRLEKDGVIKKLEKGKFYRPISSFANNVKPIKINHRNSLKKEFIIPSEIINGEKFYWSHLYQKVPVDDYIYKILKDGGLSDILNIRAKFGDKKVIEVYSKNSDLRHNKRVYLMKDFWGL